jgi:ubiquinone/menaquinone biosynthesis C-methylase UbiE
MQWYGSLLPRIHAFLPTSTVLELACGYGRWTQFLKDLCSNLYVVDLSERCIRACKQRFSECSHISYFVNDGRSLSMIPDGSVDFVFSFDSLVHADKAVLSAYLAQLPRVMKKNAVAFIHHSNLGEYSYYLAVRKVPKLTGLLARLGVLEKELHWRDFSVTARTVERYAESHGLRCISQELVNWGTRRALIDCLSTIVKQESTWCRENRIFRNRGFMREADHVSRLSQLYESK